MATVSRTVQPQLPEYLYLLSQSDGADPFIAQHYGSDLARNGEPFGELGVVQQQDAAWQDQRGKPRDPQAGNSPGVQRDVLRTSGIRAINSPNTDPPPAAAPAQVTPAAPVVEMAPFVGIQDVRLAPLAITGTPGAVATYTITDGTHTVSGSGVVGRDGKFALVVDVSSLVDGTLTVTAYLSVGSLRSATGRTTAVKDTSLPPSVGIALPGYIGLAGRAAAGVMLSGTPGNYVEWTVDGAGGTIIDSGTLDKVTGNLIAYVDFTGYADGVYSVTALQYNKAGNASPVEVSTPTLTLDTLPPTGSFTVNGAASNTALTKNPSLSLTLSFADSLSGVYQYQVSTDGKTWSAWTPYTTSTSVTLGGPDGTYFVFVSVADKAGNSFITTQKVILDRTGPTISYTLPTPTNAGSYDVGTPLAFTFGASDPNGVATISSTLDTSISLSSGGSIDVDSMLAGTHTIVITTADVLGNASTLTITFQIHATVGGLINSVKDGVVRGYIAKSVQDNLIKQLQAVQTAINNRNNPSARNNLQQFINQVNAYAGKSIAAAYAALLVNWSNDLLSRL
jgi:hypothetical protein